MVLAHLMLLARVMVLAGIMVLPLVIVLAASWFYLLTLIMVMVLSVIHFWYKPMLWCYSVLLCYLRYGFIC